MERILRCPRCNTLNPPESKFCVRCGFDLDTFFCKKCGNVVRISEEKCPYCGAELKSRYVIPPQPELPLIKDKKYKLISDSPTIIIEEVNPNLTRTLTEDDVSRFYMNYLLLYDTIETESGILPVLKIQEGLMPLDELWSKLDDVKKLEFLVDLFNTLNKGKFYVYNNLDEFYVSENLKPYISLRAESSAFFEPPIDWAKELITHLTGATDSLWEREKPRIIKETQTLEEIINWLKELRNHHREIQVEYFGMSDKGPLRSINEDSFLITTYNCVKSFKDSKLNLFKGLFVLSDGLGGHEKGDIASKLIIDLIERELVKQMVSENRINLEEIEKTVYVVNNIVYARNTERKEAREKMGGTVAGVLIINDEIAWFNVGDSPVYMIEGSGIREISHRDVSQRIAKAVSQAVGIRPSSSIDIHKGRIEQRSSEFYLLMASDGLTDVVSEEEILQIVVSEGSIESKVNRLLQMALGRKTRDNVTALLLKVKKTDLIGEPEE